MLGFSYMGLGPAFGRAVSPYIDEQLGTSVDNVPLLLAALLNSNFPVSLFEAFFRWFLYSDSDLT